MNFKKTLTAVTIALGLTVGMQTITESSNLFNPQTVQAASKKYVKAKMKLPKGYTRSALLKAYQGKPSASFIKASMKGMKDNDFSRIKAGESARDNKTKININKLTAKQKKELANFALKMINEARADLKLKPWKYSSGVQTLANDIAKEYTQNKRGINNGSHYVPGIVRACQKNGLNLEDNYVEDMAGFTSPTPKMTMTAMKKNIYFGLKQMMFGYVGSNEKGRNKKNNYREWEHAGDLFNTQGSKNTDGDYNYFGFSVSKNGKVYSMHFISVPTFVVNSSKYNLSFRP
ncbi:hypothetical protein GCM10022297_02580 [Lactobacillus hamsteri]|uniref:Surface exclusion protein n=2 Tax=Lactobacillus hamsteri TaxID=96565 RepID=A0A0R1YD48_9LACO|nr:surface exclusion protein [Lactobacillus hamsteri DSM 5661 = JCM 6256]